MSTHPSPTPPPVPGWQPHVPTPHPTQGGMGRALWIAWCVLWAVAWGTVGWIFLPFINLIFVALSLFAIAIGRPRQIIVTRS